MLAYQRVSESIDHNPQRLFIGWDLSIEIWRAANGRHWENMLFVIRIDPTGFVDPIHMHVIYIYMNNICILYIYVYRYVQIYTYIYICIYNCIYIIYRDMIYGIEEKTQLPIMMVVSWYGCMTHCFVIGHLMQTMNINECYMSYPITGGLWQF